MSATTNGGPAFPILSNDAGRTLVADRGGMSLRDYFAAKALVGILCEPIDGIQESIAYNLSDKTADVFAKASYQFADAMLKARLE